MGKGSLQLNPYRHERKSVNLKENESVNEKPDDEQKLSGILQSWKSTIEKPLMPPNKHTDLDLSITLAHPIPSCEFFENAQNSTHYVRFSQGKNSRATTEKPTTKG